MLMSLFFANRQRPVLFLVLLSTLLAAPAIAGQRPPCADLQHPCRGLLWRIEHPDSPPSYLFGTMHVTDPRVTTLPDPVRQALAGAKSFTSEMTANGTGIVHMAEAMYFSDGRKLSALLSPEWYSRLLQTLRRHGIPGGDLENKKPWAVYLLLARPSGQQPGIHLDLLLEITSIRQGKPVYALESMAEQVAVFDGLSLEDQIRLLQFALARYERSSRMQEQLLQVYLSRDLSRLYRMIESEPLADERLQKTMLERLLWARNRRMLERMRPRLKEGRAFIAVGAGHLPGPQGLLALLHRAGYRLTPVY